MPNQPLFAVIPAKAGISPPLDGRSPVSPSPYKRRGRRERGGRGYCGRGAPRRASPSPYKGRGRRERADANRPVKERPNARP